MRRRGRAAAGDCVVAGGCRPDREPASHANRDADSDGNSRIARHLDAPADGDGYEHSGADRHRDRDTLAYDEPRIQRSRRCRTTGDASGNSDGDGHPNGHAHSGADGGDQLGSDTPSACDSHPATSSGPHPGIALIEPAPGAFEHHTFESGVDIDWTHGILVTDAVTGLIEGYRLRGGKPDHFYYALQGSWVISDDLDGSNLLLDPETGQSWGWTRGAGGLGLKQTSREHLVFEEYGPSPRPYSTGRFTVVNRDMQEVARFSVIAGSDGSQVRFSPDGKTIAVATPSAVYLVPLESGQPELLFEIENGNKQGPRVTLRGFEGDPRRVSMYVTPDPGSVRGRYSYLDFSWDGERLSDPECSGHRSPDGRYVMQGPSDGSRYVRFLVQGDGSVERDDRGYSVPQGVLWGSVVIAAAETCTPIFRVHSAYQQPTGTWPHNWTSTSDGLVVGVQGGYAMLRIHPSPTLIPLPSSRPDGPPTSTTRAGSDSDVLIPLPQLVTVGPPSWKPQVAPTGGGRYVAYGPSVYDTHEDRWSGPGQAPSGETWWGDTHRERWFTIREYLGSAEDQRFLLAPHIEVAPFDDETSLRVSGTANCLPLREQPGTDNPTTDCLPDGTRLVLAELMTRLDHLQFFHRSMATAEGKLWVYVRTEDGVEGWVSHDYLEHD